MFDPGIQCGMTQEQADDVAHLIAASPDGYAAARAAYSFCLSLPMGAARIAAQGLMCQLRDYIASVTGKSVEDTQNEYELQAMTATKGENHV